jgi:hypothetical protein
MYTHTAALVVALLAACAEAVVGVSASCALASSLERSIYTHRLQVVLERVD